MSNRRHPVILANSAYQTLTRISWKRAAVLISSDLAYSMSGAPSVKAVRTPRTIIDVRAVVLLRRNVYRPYRSVDIDSPATNAMILRRDDYLCGYCGGKATTVDHVIPKARRGSNTWGNLVAACAVCNGRKACRTPEQADMPLLHAPYVYDPAAEDQAEIRALFTLTDDPD